MSRGRLVVFARQPRPGSVKTRLTPPLTAGEAAELYACMLEDVLAVSAAAARALDLEAVLAVHPGRAAGELALQAPPPFRAVAQCGLDLAERMAWALGEAGAAAAWPVLLRGSDSPTLSPARVSETLHTLVEADVVIVPDLDGGYSLIGVRKPAPRLFDHAMSTRTVAEDTRANAETLGLSTRILDPCFDVDEVGDLRWLAQARGSGAAELCPRTLACLDQGSLWRHLGPAAQGGVTG